MSRLFEPKFSSGRTKCEAIAVDVIFPTCTDELRLELNRGKFVTVIIDASSMKEVKLVSTVIGYFWRWR